MTRAEAFRKLAHLAAFWPAWLLSWLNPLAALGVTALLLAMNLFVLPRLAKVLYREKEVGRGGLEILLYPAALMASVAATGLRAGAGKPAWFLPLLAAWFGLSVVDACIGTACRIIPAGTRLPWNERKTWMGVLLGLAVSALPAWLLVHLGFPTLTAIQWISLGALLFLAGSAETVWFGVADNIVIPFTICIMIPLFANPLFPDPTAISPTTGAMPGNWLGPGFSVAGMDLRQVALWGCVAAAFGVAAFAAKLLTAGGAWLGGLFALDLCLAEPWLFAFLGAFFVLGNLATRWGMAAKQARGIAEPARGRRGAGQVFGAMGLAVWMTPLVHLARRYQADHSATLIHAALLVCIAPLAAKTMDTVSSEIGKARAGKTLSLWTLRTVPAGTKGGVSRSGTLIGLCGAGCLAIGAMALGWAGISDAVILVLIAVLANVFESLWGEWAVRHDLDQGAHTNILMTLFAAVLAWLWWFGRV